MNTTSATYTIRVHSHLDYHWSPWLGEADIINENDGTTTLTVVIADQAQLHGVLAALRDIGAVITELRATSAPIPSWPNPTRSSAALAVPQAHPDLERLG